MHHALGPLLLPLLILPMQNNKSITALLIHDVQKNIALRVGLILCQIQHSASLCPVFAIWLHPLVTVFPVHHPQWSLNIYKQQQTNNKSFPTIQTFRQYHMSVGYGRHNMSMMSWWFLALQKPPKSKRMLQAVLWKTNKYTWYVTVMMSIIMIVCLYVHDT